MEPNYQKGIAAGFTLIELLIASVLLSIMIMAVSTLSISGAEAQEYARRLNRATEVTQDVMDQMRLEMVSCVRIFGSDTEGTSNRALLDLAGAPTPSASLRLPTISANESIRKDTTGAEITGNTLFFTKLAWSDRFVCSGGNDYLVDVFRWVYYYLTPETPGPAAGSPIGLNLVRVVGEPLIDALSVDRITDPTDQAEVLLHLVTASADANGITHAPCQVVWRRGSLASVVGTLRQINEADGTLSNSPLVGRPNPWNILRADSAISGMLTYRHHSIATNYARQSFGVGRYGILSNTGGGFPHGFEIQVVGPSSARQVLIHLVVASTNRRGQFAWSDLQVSIDSRDL